MKNKPKAQKPAPGKLGGFLSRVYYPISARQGYTITGKVEWKNEADAWAEANKRIAAFELSGTAE